MSQSKWSEIEVVRELWQRTQQLAFSGITEGIAIRDG